MPALGPDGQVPRMVAGTGPFKLNREGIICLAVGATCWVLVFLALLGH